MKNPFKKQSLTDTLINVGIGGGANVAIDYVWNMVGLDSTLASFAGETVSPGTIKNAIKIIGGAVVGGMVKNKYARAAADGVAVVGVSNLISSLISDTTGGGNENGTENENKTPSGLPYGMIGAAGRYRLGQRGFARHMSGVGAAPSALMAK